MAVSQAVTTDSAATYASVPELFDRAERLISMGRLEVALDGLSDALNTLRDDLPASEWTALARSAALEPLARIVHQDPFTRRAFEKPRGYAGDAVMMDLAYGVHGYRQAATDASPVGYAVMEWLRRRDACTSVRLRCEHITALIDQLAATKPAPEILAVAAGHFREAERSSAIRWGSVGRVVALDADADSVAEVASRYGHLGVEAVKGSVRELLARKTKVGTFDFVYAAGLYDYLVDPVAIALTSRLFELTNPGGQLLIPNFTPDCPDRGYMETFMAWNLIYRDEFDMTRLVSRLPAAEIDRYDIYADRTGSIVYLLIRKAG